MIAQLRDGVGQFRLQILKAAGEFQHGAAGVGQHDVASRAVEEFLPQFRFETLQGERDGGLRPSQLLRGAREAALVGHRHEDPEGSEFHFYQSTLAPVCG